MSEEKRKNPFCDNPEWDATDGACSGWWRGQEHGVKSAVAVINKLLDSIEAGERPSGWFASKELNILRDRLTKLYKQRT